MYSASVPLHQSPTSFPLFALNVGVSVVRLLPSTSVQFTLGSLPVVHLLWV